MTNDLLIQLKAEIVKLTEERQTLEHEEHQLRHAAEGKQATIKRISEKIKTLARASTELESDHTRI